MRQPSVPDAHLLQIKAVGTEPILTCYCARRGAEHHAARVEVADAIVVLRPRTCRAAECGARRGPRSWGPRGWCSAAAGPEIRLENLAAEDQAELQAPQLLRERLLEEAGPPRCARCTGDPRSESWHWAGCCARMMFPELPKRLQFVRMAAAPGRRTSGRTRSRSRTPTGQSWQPPSPCGRPTRGRGGMGHGGRFGQPTWAAHSAQPTWDVPWNRTAPGSTWCRREPPRAPTFPGRKRGLGRRRGPMASRAAAAAPSSRTSRRATLPYPRRRSCRSHLRPRDDVSASSQKLAVCLVVSTSQGRPGISASGCSAGPLPICSLSPRGSRRAGRTQRRPVPRRAGRSAAASFCGGQRTGGDCRFCPAVAPEGQWGRRAR